NTNVRLTSDDGSERNPVWWPDSQYLLFTSDKSGYSLLKMSIGSTANPQLLLQTNEIFRPMDIARNNTLVLRDNGLSFFTFVPGSSQPPTPFLRTRFLKSGGRLSPNGKWLAFNSDDSGRSEIYVVPFPKADHRLPISTNGGLQPLWSAN